MLGAKGLSKGPSERLRLPSTFASTKHLDDWHADAQFLSIARKANRDGPSGSCPSSYQQPRAHPMWTRRPETAPLSSYQSKSWASELQSRSPTASDTNWTSGRLCTSSANQTTTNSEPMKAGLIGSEQVSQAMQTQDGKNGCPASCRILGSMVWVLRVPHNPLIMFCALSNVSLLSAVLG